MRFLIAAIILSIAVFISYITFKPYTNYVEFHVHYVDTFGTVGAILKMDSIFSIQPEYVKLKHKEYNRVLKTKDLAAAFDKQTLGELYDILRPYDDVDRQLLRNVLRASLCFKAIDENNLPYSKEEQVEKIMRSYNNGIID